MSRTGFTPEIRDRVRAGAIQSAEVVVPLLLDEFPDVRRIVDVGCGEGWWTRAFGARVEPYGGCALGLDYDVVDGDEPGYGFRQADLARPIVGDDYLGPFDLAVSLEVAEHLPPERAAGFVADLCALAPIVVFSAAIPGQGGTGHLNEQPPDYWTTLFHAQGFAVSGYLRWRIWDDDRIENWYRQNLLVAVGGEFYVHRTPAAAEFHADSPPRYAIHPVLWDARRPR